MFHFFSSFILTTLIFASASSDDVSLRHHQLSARRGPSQRWQARVRSTPGPRNRDYAIDVAVVLESLDVSPVTKLKNFATIQKYFERVRDHRFEQDPELDEDFLRRVTWMYPDDGCFARAQLVNQFLTSWKETPVTKIFAFGDLSVQSPNASSGSVPWWYHVANVVTDGKNVYVLDPAVEPLRPLLLEEWVGRLNDPLMGLSVCHPETYTPYSPCSNPDPSEALTATEDDVYFFPSEKERIEELGRKWRDELGEFPPWLGIKREPLWGAPKCQRAG